MGGDSEWVLEGLPVGGGREDGACFGVGGEEGVVRREDWI